MQNMNMIIEFLMNCSHINNIHWRWPDLGTNPEARNVTYFQ